MGTATSGSHAQWTDDNGANLIAIAHRAGEKATPPRRPTCFERRLSVPRKPNKETCASAGGPKVSSLEPHIVTHATVEFKVAKADRAEFYARRLQLPGHILIGDSVDAPSRSKLWLFEDGAPLGPAHATPQSVAEMGRAATFIRRASPIAQTPMVAIR